MRMNHRDHERTYPTGEKIAWHEGTHAPLRAARVLNLSRTGIALSISGEAPVGHGGKIRTLSRRSEPPRWARVVRIEHIHRGGEPETRLACRWISGRNKPEASSRPRRDWSLINDVDEGSPRTQQHKEAA